MQEHERTREKTAYLSAHTLPLKKGETKKKRKSVHPTVHRENIDYSLGIKCGNTFAAVARKPTTETIPLPPNNQNHITHTEPHHPQTTHR